MSISMSIEEGIECPEEFLQIIEDIVSFSLDYLECPYECEVSVTITDDEEIRVINRDNREIDKPTDVLSFPMIDFSSPCDYECIDEECDYMFNIDTGELLLGDIVISIEKVYEQAREYNHSPKREIAFLTAHSMLHLLGYDHIDDEERKVMEVLQEEILDKKGYTRDYC